MASVRRAVAATLGVRLLLEILPDVQDQTADVVARSVDGRGQVRDGRLVAEVARGEPIGGPALQGRGQLERGDATFDVRDPEQVRLRMRTRAPSGDRAAAGRGRSRRRSRD